MSLPLVDYLLAGGLASVASFSGWWLRGAIAARQESPSRTQQANEALARLHSLAADVAKDVGRHNEQIVQINGELAGDNSKEVAAIVERLVAVNEHMKQQLDDAEDRLQQQQVALETHLADARTDALTGLFNRRGFDEELARRAAEKKRHGREVSLMMIDVDHFKKFNDTHGHQAGDEVLRGVARVLKSTMREMDVVCRYGGEEFSVVLTGTDCERAKSAARRACRAIEAASFPFEDKELNVTASIGLAELSAEETSAQIIKRADDALYASKKAGRNCGHLNTGKKNVPLDEKPAEPPKAKAEPPKPQAEPLKAPAEVPQAKPEPPQSGVAPVPTPEPDPTPAAAANQDDDGRELDSITGLYNRKAFAVEAARRLADHRTNGAPLTAMFLRINEADELEAEHGERSLNMVLKAVTQFLRAVLSDVDYAARYDHATFAVLLPSGTTDEVRFRADRLRTAIQRCELKPGGKRLKFSASIAVDKPQAGEDHEQFAKRLDEQVAAPVAATV